MSDLYTQFVNSPVGKPLAQTFGLPTPVPLRRYEPGQPVVEGPVLVGATKGGRLTDAILATLHEIHANVQPEDGAESRDGYAALVFDATGITDSSQLRELYEFFHPTVKRMGSSARLLVLGTPPEDCTDAREATAQRALEGFTRSAGKEMRNGSTANLIRVADGAEAGLESTLRFFLSGRSAYVSGQVAAVGTTGEASAGTAKGAAGDGSLDWDQPLAGKVAVVTGAARGIGAAIAETLARDGAHVVCLDLPAMGDQLSAVANRIGGSTLQVDITAEDAPRTIASHLNDRHGGVDVFVHNAGVTRDKTLVGMNEGQWDMVLDINLTAQERINDMLLEGLLNDNGRIISVSSMSGIAGNRGQTNYATSKAGIIGMVRALAPTVAARGATINAVAPGFIETEMTAAMPIGPREAGRRMNSLSQGGLPVDVAETIAWFANPASARVNGNVVRVCGQSLLGA